MYGKGSGQWMVKGTGSAESNNGSRIVCKSLEPVKILDDKNLRSCMIYYPG